MMTLLLHGLLALLGVHWGTASLLEVVWTGVGLIGLLYSVLLYGESMADREALRRWPPLDPHGPRVVLVRGHLRAARHRALLFAVFAGLGLVAMNAPAPAAGVVNPVSVVFSLGLLLMEVVLASGARTDRRDRLVLLRMVDALLTTEREH